MIRSAARAALVAGLLAGAFGGAAHARSDSADAMVAAAEEAIAAGRAQDAERILREAVAADPSHWKGHCLLGQVLASSGRYPEAEVSLEAAVAVREDAACLSRLAQVLLVAGRFDRAEQVLRRGIAADPAEEGALFNLARLLERGERFEEAVPIWERYIEVSGDPDRRVAAHLRAGRMLELLGRPVDAARHLRSVVQADPDRHDVRAELGTALMRASRYEEALAEYDRVDAAGAMDAKALSNAGSICLILKDAPRAVLLLERSVALDANSIPTRIALATAQAQAGADAGAVATLEAIARDDPDNVRAWFLMAQSLRRLGRAEEARRALERHREIHERIMKGRMGEPDPGGGIH